MAGAEQQRVLILNFFAHLPGMKQPGIAFVNVRVEARPSYVVIRSHGLGVLVARAKFLPVVLLHLSSEALVAGVVGVPVRWLGRHSERFFATYRVV